MAFLYRLYATTRAQEMALLADWSDARKEDFVRGQFNAQHAHYQSHYPDARYDIIVKSRDDIGRLYVCPMTNEIRLMDITLLPERRNRGIGGALVREVMAEAEDSQRFVSLYVEDENPAKRLYERLGFVDAGEVPFYKLMRWVPSGLTPVFADASTT